MSGPAQRCCICILYIAGRGSCICVAQCLFKHHRRKDLFNEGPPVDNCAPYLGGPAHRELDIHKFSFLSLCRRARPPQNIELTGKHTHFCFVYSIYIGTLISTISFYGAQRCIFCNLLLYFFFRRM